MGQNQKEGRKGSSIVVENDAGNTRIYAHRCTEKTHLSALAVADLFARHAAFPRREKSGLFIWGGMGLGESRSGDSRDAGQR